MNDAHSSGTPTYKNLEQCASRSPCFTKAHGATPTVLFRYIKITQLYYWYYTSWYIYCFKLLLSNSFYMSILFNYRGRFISAASMIRPFFIFSICSFIPVNWLRKLLDSLMWLVSPSVLIFSAMLLIWFLWMREPLMFWINWFELSKKLGFY